MWDNRSTGRCPYQQDAQQAHTPPAQAKGKVVTEAACVLIKKDDKILLVSVNPRFGTGWCLPGGKHEPGELGKDAAKRELYEETGLVVDYGDMHFIYYGPSVEPGFLVTTYKAEYWEGEPKEMEAGLQVKWGTKEDLLASPFSKYYSRFAHEL